MATATGSNAGESIGRGGKPRAIALGVLALIAAALSGCGPSPKAAAPQQVAAPPPTAAAPAPPARMMKMVCRNSQTGAKADCGTPNAVMVGMKPA